MQKEINAFYILFSWLYFKKKYFKIDRYDIINLTQESMYKYNFHI